MSDIRSLSPVRDIRRRQFASCGASLPLPFISYRRLSFLVSLCFFLTNSAPASAEPRTVRIGLIAPLTGSLSMRGEDISKTAEVSVHYFNRWDEAAVRYQLLVEDGKCGAGNAAVSAVKKLINVDDIDFLITSCSGETLQAAPVAERNKIITFAVLSLHQDVKQLGDHVFRTYVDIEEGIKPFLRRMAAAGPVAMLTEENAYTLGIKELTKKQLGTGIVYAEDFPEDTTDFRTLLAKVRAKKPAALFLNPMSVRSLSILVNQLRGMRFSQQIFSNLQAEDLQFVENCKENADGVIYTGTPANENLPAGYLSVRAEIEKGRGHRPTHEFGMRATYDALAALRAAVLAGSTDPEAVRKFLAAYTADGATGPVRFDKNGDIEGLEFRTMRMVKGRGETVEN